MAHCLTKGDGWKWNLLRTKLNVSLHTLSVLGWTNPKKLPIKFQSSNEEIVWGHYISLLYICSTDQTAILMDLLRLFYTRNETQCIVSLFTTARIVMKTSLWRFTISIMSTSRSTPTSQFFVGPVNLVCISRMIRCTKTCKQTRMIEESRVNILRRPLSSLFQ